MRVLEIPRAGASSSELVFLLFHTFPQASFFEGAEPFITEFLINYWYSSVPRFGRGSVAPLRTQAHWEFSICAWRLAHASPSAIQPRNPARISTSTLSFPLRVLSGFLFFKWRDTRPLAPRSISHVHPRPTKKNRRDRSRASLPFPDLVYRDRISALLSAFDPTGGSPFLSSSICSFRYTSELIS